MIKTLRRLARKHPDQAFLILFNTGIFAWLQATGLLIADKIGLHFEIAQNLLPDWLKTVIGNSVQSFQAYFGSHAISWLVVSMIVTFLIRFIKGALKMLIMIVIIVVGLYLVIKNYDILNQLIK